MWNLSSSPFLCRHAIPWRRRRRRLSPHSVGMRPVGQQQFANFRSGAVADLASWKMRDVDLIREQFEAGWWFGTCFIFPYIGNNHPNWLIFFFREHTGNDWMNFVGNMVIENCVQFWVIFWEENWDFTGLRTWWLSIIKQVRKKQSDLMTYDKCGFYMETYGELI